ncbi:MAG: SLC13 family permease [Candidatus Asgardarchaeia archaeon]
MELWAIAIFIIFAIVMIITITEKIDKTSATILGAILTYLILSLEGTTLDEVINFIDFPTIMTMFGVLVAGTIVNDSGLFQWAAIKLVKLTKGEPVKLFVLLTLLVILLSSILTIFVAAIIVSRVTISITRALDIDSKPFLLASSVAVSIGGVTSLIASPASILIAESAHLNLIFFIIYTMPIGLITGGLFIFVLQRKLNLPKDIPEIRKSVLMEFDEWSVVPDKKLFYMSAVLLFGMIAGFLLFPEPHLVAFTGGVLFLIVRKSEFDEVAHELEWSDIFFFIGIFIIVGGIEHTGILIEIGNLLGSVSRGNPLLPLMIVVWFVGLTSGFLDAIVLALLFIPIINELVIVGGFQNYFYIFIISLILSANIGGCLTPIGTPANLIILSRGQKEGANISAKEFLKYGVIAVILGLIIESIYVMIIYFYFAF